MNANQLQLSWPDLAQQARQAAAKHTALVAEQRGLTASDAVVNMHNDAKAQTLTATSQVLAAGPLDVGTGTPENQSPPTPHFASVQGNSGQLSYSYPLTVAAGPAGTTPQLQLTYSSEGVNERHSMLSPSEDVGEGWSLSLGAITTEVNGPMSAGVGTWYFISGADRVSERMVPDSTGNNFVTEHLSYLRINKVTSSFGQPCFDVWGTDGTFYEYGCTQDSLQFYIDGSGTRQNYRWDLDHVVPTPEGPGTSGRYINIIYERDMLPNGAGVRDSGIKQITYGSGVGSQSQAGVVDFYYWAPTTDANWSTAYSSSYYSTCQAPAGTTLRCDDPINRSGGLNAPTVMGTMSLQSVTSFIGNDSSPNNTVAKYQFAYSDGLYEGCSDDYTQEVAFCAGEHLLTKVTPTAYLHGVGTALRPLDLTYSQGLTDQYYDTTQMVTGGSLYHVTTAWRYLTDYHDNQSGVGAHVMYLTAHENTHGTPTDSNGDGSYDPFYCNTHTTCTGTYAYPDDRAWSVQVVTAITNSGKDSSASSLALAKTTYDYQLSPLTGGYVGDNWIPMGNAGNKDADWAAFYHGEFQGFPVVFTTSPANTLTVDDYSSTEGWFTTQGDWQNYTAGQLREHDIYGNWQVSNWHLISSTVNTYAGDPGTSTHNACNGNYSGVYTPCLAAIIKSRTTTYEQNNAAANSPWVEHDYAYDDFNSNGLVISNTVYHNLLQETISSSNAPTITKKWTYQPTNTTINGWVYYDVNKVGHSELDDASGHIWSCEDVAYDEGRASGVPSPSAGWVTTDTVYPDCTNAGTGLRNFTSYDLSGNVVAHVDTFGGMNGNPYGTHGCTLASAPPITTPNWT